MSAAPLLTRLYADGRAAWPGLGLDEDAFTRYWSARFGDGPPESPSASELFLACACALGVPGAIEAFERAIVSRVPLYLSRTRPSPERVAETQQALRERLFVARGETPGKIHDYGGRGSLDGWARVVTLRVAANLRDPRPSSPLDKEPASPALSDPHLELVRRRYREDFERAFAEAVSSLSTEHRQLLRMHFVDGLTLDELASASGMHRASIARHLAAARKAILSGARSTLRTQLGVGAAELDSLLGLLHSQIDVSLFRLLGSGAKGV